ncbi:MAG: SDR family oxidoreductase [Bradymonadaceae bacterium]|nr:SDR family oxidoreductase [Lujinxingiaceae bacterium]
MRRTVLVTGGSSGIGLETARAFVACGERVIICSRDNEKLARAALELGVESHVLDVTDQKAVEDLFEAIGPLDALVANAGICQQARLDDTQSDDVWRRTLDINLNGVYHCLKAAQRTMPEGSAIVTVSSGLGKNARAGYEAYTASKHAVLGLTKCVALELAPRNIRVNAVCPGWVDTPMSQADAAEGARRAGLAEDDFRRQAVEAIPLGRMVDPAEVASLIFFLCSSAARAITGQSYNVSCGEFTN